MKVCHAIGWYFPESSGGTEVYVDRLTHDLVDLGVESVIVAATDAPAAAQSSWRSIPVHRYSVPPATHEELIDGQPPGGLSAFERSLDELGCDIYHQHSWTRGCGLWHLQTAKRLGLPAVVTLHMPSAICLRDTMMLNGVEACDGRVSIDRCTACWGTSRGIPRALAFGLSKAPALSALAAAVPHSRLHTALLTPRFVARRQKELAALANLADRVVVHCHWMLEALALNGIARHKLVFCPQGVDVPADFRSSATPRSRTGVFRIGFLGRWNHIKGIHVLVDAVVATPRELTVELVLRALPGDDAYERRVRRSASGDSRIRFEDPVSSTAVFSALSDIDILAVPSLWLETGPLVVLEAFAAGRPVLGSRLGGIAELVTDGGNGRLVDAGDTAAWTRAITELASHPDGPGRLRPSQPRSGRDVALQTAALYDELAHLSVSADAVNGANPIEHVV